MGLSLFPQITRLSSQILSQIHECSCSASIKALVSRVNHLLSTFSEYTSLPSTHCCNGAPLGRPFLNVFPWFNSSIRACDDSKWLLKFHIFLLFFPIVLSVASYRQLLQFCSATLFNFCIHWILWSYELKHVLLLLLLELIRLPEHPIGWFINPSTRFTFVSSESRSTCPTFRSPFRLRMVFVRINTSITALIFTGSTLFSCNCVLPKLAGLWISWYTFMLTSVAFASSITTAARILILVNHYSF